MAIETQFDRIFATSLALREKQIQQSYRPIIGIHKWFARRPGTVFRNLLLAEFNGHEPLETGYWRAHGFKGVVADPFMGGGTPVLEANRLGFNVIGADVNPMAFWIVRQSLASLNIEAFVAEAAAATADVERLIGEYYATECGFCSGQAQVKYFLWVKTAECPKCLKENDLFPGYLLAEDVRHPRNVVACASCGCLNEVVEIPTAQCPARCSDCGEAVAVEGRVKRSRTSCRHCQAAFRVPAVEPHGPPKHRMWAIEYHCPRCKPSFKGRFFKRPDVADHSRFANAAAAFGNRDDLPIPDAVIPAGDESSRLHRWGYSRYREMFNDRQLLGLGLLLNRIRIVADLETRNALLTVFSDFLRYQNMLCRYDTYALKCQDIFSVHGFPVGLVQCENNLLGIRGVGSGAFRHFVEKYVRAKEYCELPFETQHSGGRKTRRWIHGESIESEIVSEFPKGETRQAWLIAASSKTVQLEPGTLDAVFTDPPYFDNVQYAELMDFCYVWLRQVLAAESEIFEPVTTRNTDELTGNASQGKGIEHFTAGISEVFRNFACALKSGAPFVFTYHHNDPMAYLPLVVAILDAELDCTATLPAAAEMSASLHIHGTGSSVLDSIFVCRSHVDWPVEPGAHADAEAVASACFEALHRDAKDMSAAGVKIREGDLRCLLAGHVARFAVNALRPDWMRTDPMETRMAIARTELAEITGRLDVISIIGNILDGEGAREEANAAAV